MFWATRAPAVRAALAAAAIAVFAVPAAMYQHGPAVRGR